MYHMVFKSGVRRLQRLALLGVATIGVAGFLAAVSSTQMASAATTIKNLATSSSSTLQTRWYSLRGYGSIRNEVYWPQRSDNCGGGGDKISPWQPSIVGLYSGNIFNQSSNCVDRYSDAGTTANGGAWIQPLAQGSWSIGGAAPNWQNFSYPGFTSVVNNCGSLIGGGAARIWGHNGPDTSDQFYTSGPVGNGGGSVAGLYNQLYAGGAQSTKLYSNGVTLIRDSFTLDATDISRLGQSTTKLMLQAYADDWVRVYVNGIPAQYSFTSVGLVQLDMSADIGLLHTGTNWVGIMVADKGVFDTSDPGARGAGVCYNLQYQYDQDFSLSPNVAPSVYRNGVFQGTSIAQVGDQIQFKYTVANNSPGTTSGSTNCTIYSNEYTGSHSPPTPADTGTVNGPQTTLMQAQCSTVIGPNGTVSITETVPVAGSDGGKTICRSLYVNPTSLSGGTGSDEACVAVTLNPYFQVVGGDIAAGITFGAGSCTGGTANIESWNQNTSPNYFGGGSTLGALATGTITNFVSGMGLAGGAGSQSGHGLSFANSGAGVSASPPSYGGSFGTSGMPCVDDYYGTKATSGPDTIGGPITSLSGGNHIVTPSGGTVQIGNGAHSPITVAPGTTTTLYVQGNVYISSNIIYANYSLGTVPRFNLYVQGNIYIDPNVTELHGVYIAQKSSSGSYGDIVTCAASPTDTSEPYATCAKQLQVVGAMAAEGGMHLTRTYGNLQAAPGAPAAPAEIFQYSPELWLNAPPLTSLPVKTYTSLPPVL